MVDADGQEFKVFCTELTLVSWEFVGFVAGTFFVASGMESAGHANHNVSNSSRSSSAPQ